MALTSPQFIVFILAVVLAFHAHPSANYRRVILTAANAIFLGSFVASFLQLVPLVLFLCVGYAALKTSRPDRRSLSVAWIVIIVVLFAYLKKYAFLEPLPPLPFLYLGIGLSYILFRMLQLVIDQATEGVEQNIHPITFFNYTCNFLCFISGPIQRSGDFTTGLKNLTRPVDAALAYRSFARIVLGYMKVLVVSATAKYLFDHVSEGLLTDAPTDAYRTLAVAYALAVITFTAYLYYNFAGYMDIVIGIGWLLGADLPENFDHPFRARNLFDFWARWHMTLSNWFKTYLFNPLVTAAASRVTSPGAMPYIGVAAFFVTFFIMGVWHGSTVVFVIYGLVMGAGVSITKVWQITLAKKLGRKGYKALGETLLYASTAQGVTAAFFSIAVTALWVDLDQLTRLGSRLGIGGSAAVFVALSVLGAIFLPLADWTSVRIARMSARLAAVNPGIVGRQAALGAQVLLVVAVTSFFHKAPEFVYKAF